MDERGQRRVAELMSAVAGGDRAAIFTLLEEFRPQLAAAARRAARRMGVTLTTEDEEELAVEVALALVSVAGTWRPDGGALPWVWAERRTEAMVARWAGPHHAWLDDDPDAHPEQPLLHAARDTDLRSLLAAAADPRLRGIVRLGDQIGWAKLEIWLEVEQQRAQGDPSPSETVARLTGRSAPAVRQVCSRARRVARLLVAADPDLAALAASSLVA